MDRRLSPAARKLVAAKQAQASSRYPHLRALCAKSVLVVVIAIFFVGILLVLVDLGQNYFEVLDEAQFTVQLYAEQCTNYGEQRSNPVRERDCQQRRELLDSIKRYGAYNKAVLRFLKSHNLCGGVACVTYFRDSLNSLLWWGALFLVCLTILLIYAYRLADSLINWDLSRNQSKSGIIGSGLIEDHMRTAQISKPHSLLLSDLHVKED